MMTWTMINFPNSSSPLMEQLIFFHDHSMVIIILITIMILYLMINMSVSKTTNRFLIEEQDLETIWTILPALMLLFIAFPSLHLLYLLEETYNPSITMKIIGHQWYWSYEYSNFNINFDSFLIPKNESNMNSFYLLDTDNNLVLPYKTNIQFLITAADVIHSWTVPSLGLKMDAIPGRLNQNFSLSNSPGLYFGQCSEICGANHSFMPICLEFISNKKFIKWINNMV